ncbi:extracellular solute-binding protein [Diplocloster modestus]|uniref:Extracellular solute-binding protein n=1 Tax=Diplocloster modestus TaxID=2850322 RepID=A0ABS6KET6_9FIRM|nr:extracellular solute-binding protein [Diplocloster modestus]MBU9729025.1 extracellular solute-binding protein [Diplocloster modestus]
MRKMWKKVLTAGLCVVTMAMLLTGCGSDGAAGGQNQGSTDSGTGGTTASAADGETVHLKIATCVAPPNNMDKIVEQANEILREKLNITIEVVPLAFDSSKYNLLLTTGNDVDLIYTATWAKFQTNALDGAYLPLKELIRKEVPKLWSSIPEDSWKKCEIDGEIYNIPSTSDDLLEIGFTYREDLRKKYNLPEITDVASMEAYFKGIQENESTMVACSDRGGRINEMFQILNGWYAMSNDLAYDLKGDQGVVVYSKTDSFKQGVETARKWVENGWIDSDIISTDVDSAGQFLSGKYASTISYATGESFNLIYSPALVSNPDWEIKMVNFGAMGQRVLQKHPMHTAFGMPKASPHPVEALKFMLELRTNEELYQLLDCGILGEDYEVADSGNYKSLNSAQHPAFTKEGLGLTGFYYSVPELSLKPEHYEYVADVYQTMEPFVVDNTIMGFPADDTAVKAEVTAVNQLISQYLNPLINGMVDDTDAGIEDLNKRLDEAGIEKIHETILMQANDYMAVIQGE